MVHGFTVGLALIYLIAMGGATWELWIWTRVIKPMLATRNPTLLAELPLTVFRWLFQRGGLTMAMYCYFEMIGVGVSGRAFEDIDPWLVANNVVLIHLTSSAVLTVTLLATSRTSLSTVLRGLAPLHEKVGLTIVFITSLIPLVLFSGREFTDHQQKSLYGVGYACFLLLWPIIFGIMACGHASQSQDGTAKVQTLAAQEGGRGKGGDVVDGVSGQRQGSSLIFSAVSGSSVVNIGI